MAEVAAGIFIDPANQFTQLDREAVRIVIEGGVVQHLAQGTLPLINLDQNLVQTVNCHIQLLAQTLDVARRRLQIGQQTVYPGTTSLRSKSTRLNSSHVAI